MTKDEFLSRWTWTLSLAAPEFVERFEADLDALLELEREEEREAVLEDGDAMREAMRGAR